MPQQPTITTTIEGPANLVRHIEDLQASLSRRNDEIARLTEENERLRQGVPDEGALRRAYMKGRAEATAELRKHSQAFRTAAYDLTYALDDIARTEPSEPLTAAVAVPETPEA